MPGQKRSRPAASRLPRFSPSRLSLYLFCPRAYFFYYRRGYRWGGGTPGHAFGGSLHRVLQQFHARGGAELMTLEELREELRARWSESGYSSAEEAAEHLEAADELLGKYHAAAVEPGRRTLWTEVTLQYRYTDFVLFGKIDRLDRRPDGALEVIDYKSGRYTVTQEEVREGLALKVYQLLVARHYPRREVYTGILCLPTGEQTSVLRSREELYEVETELRRLVHTILLDDELAATPGPQCRECSYPRICPYGRQWLRGHPVGEGV